MKKSLLIALFVISLLIGMSSYSSARVDVDINIGLPVYTFVEPPELVVIPNTYVYYAPAVDFDIVFYHGYWYRPWGGRWYRATFYNGPWTYVVRERVPRYVWGLPPNFRVIYRDYPRIPYYHVHENWHRWERERYWHRRQWKHDQNEWKREIRQERREHQQDRREMRQNMRERRQDMREHRQDVRERRQDMREHRQDVRERRQDMREQRQNNLKERRQDMREQRQDVRERRQDVRGEHAEKQHNVKPDNKPANRQDRRDEKPKPEGGRR